MIEVDAAGLIRVAVTAPPDDGAANRAVVELVAEAFRVPKSSITILRGQTSRTKTLTFSTLTSDDLTGRIAGLPRR